MNARSAAGLRLDEHQLRDVLAVKAVETAGNVGALWNDTDRAWATRAAAEVVTAAGSEAAFVTRRAELALERLRERDPRLVQVMTAFRWRGWIAPSILAAALVIGILGNRIGTTARVDILAPPILGLLAWNLTVYAVLLGRVLLARGRRHDGGLRRLLTAIATAGSRLRGRQPGGSHGVFTSFLTAWTHSVGALYALRSARILHLAAAAVAIGALLGLYARGLVLEYRAAWESTFLGAAEVHRLVTVVLSPAAALTGLAIPSVERIAALRTDAGNGENAALWLHLYAVTVVIVVLAPRLLLALGTTLALRRARARLGLPRDDAYLQRLTRGFREGPLRVRVVPYSVSPSPIALEALQGLLTRVFGRCEITTTAPVPYGTEPDPAGEDRGLVLALFSATATPEPETHGAFVAGLANAGGVSERLAIVDESSFRERWPRDDARLAERRAAWEAVLAPQVPVLFLQLARLDIDAAGPALERVLAGVRP